MTSVNVGATIAPKSDQLNADDLIGQNRILKIREVKGNTDTAQPISIYYEGDNNKPYKPCLSMRRVLVRAWGSEGLNYVGKSIEVYRNESVSFGGVAVGGIRISKMSDIDSSLTLALAESKAKKKPFTVQPLIQKEKVKEDLTPQHAKWAGAVGAIKVGSTTIDKIKSSYVLSAEHEAQLIKEGANENV